MRYFFRISLFIFYLYGGYFFNWEFPFLGIQLNSIASANNTIHISAVVLGPPLTPTLTLSEICFHEKNLAIAINWQKDSNSDTYTLFRNGALLADHITINEYTDQNITLNTTYTYTVTAHGSMGDGIASSESKSLSPKKQCPTKFNPPYIHIHSFDKQDLLSSETFLETQNPRPQFSGSINIANAIVVTSIQNTPKIIFNEIHVNANGYWNQTPETDLEPGYYTFYIFVRDPNNSAIISSKNIPFLITTEKTIKDLENNTLSEKILSSSYSTSQANQLSQPPFDFIFSLKNTAELQKKKLVASIKTPNFPEKYRGKEFTVKFSILNENGNEILESFHKTIKLTKDSTLDQSIEIPLYARNGLHSIQAEVSFENYSVHKQKYFDMHITPAVIRLTP